jgi:hypothetical protein
MIDHLAGGSRESDVARPVGKRRAWPEAPSGRRHERAFRGTRSARVAKIRKAECHPFGKELWQSLKTPVR